jgi:hypothetical protein
MIGVSTRDAALDSVAFARRRRAEGKLFEEHRDLGTGLLEAISVAVTHPRGTEVRRELDGFGAVELFCRFADLTSAVLREVAEGRMRASSIGGNYALVTIAPAAWLVSERDVGDRLVRDANHPNLAEVGTPFWREYGRALLHVVLDEPYLPLTPKLKRAEEQSWSVYLDLVEATTNRRDVTEVFVKVRDAFAARNRDKRLGFQAYVIEGSGRDPVAYDLRTESILVRSGNVDLATP